MTLSRTTLSAPPIKKRSPTKIMQQLGIKIRYAVEGTEELANYYAPVWALEWIAHILLMPAGAYRRELIVAGLRYFSSHPTQAGAMLTLLAVKTGKEEGTKRVLSTTPTGAIQKSAAVSYLWGYLCTECKGLGGLRIGDLGVALKLCKTCKGTGEAP